MVSRPIDKLLVATTNLKKLIELRDLLADLNLTLLCLRDLPHFDEISEDGETFQENAELKAVGYARQTGLLTLAEDSGLVCDALEGAPGVYSARFAGLLKSDDENNRKVLKLLEEVTEDKRGAHFVSAVAIAEPERLIAVVEGKVDGLICREACGTNGFGYDPIFFYPLYGKTFGEVPAEMKHRVSHRAQALAKAKLVLQSYLKPA